MTISIGRAVAVVASGLAMSVVPLAFTTVATPAPSRAECGAGQTGADCTPAAADCPSDRVVYEKTGECLDQVTAIQRQLEALPPPPQLAGFSASQGANGAPVLNVPPPQLNVPAPQLYAPDVVLPGVGFGVSLFPIQWPDLSQLPPPQLPDLTQIPPPQLPDLTKIPPPRLPW